MVPCNSLIVTRRDPFPTRIALSSTLLPGLCPRRLLRLRLLGGDTRHRPIDDRPALRIQPLSTALGAVHIVVGDSAALGRTVMAGGRGFWVEGLVVVIVCFGIEGDNVPGVQEAGEVAERAEQNVDDRVGGADAAFDPDCFGGGGRKN